jgi:hypothetical protein
MFCHCPRCGERFRTYGRGSPLLAALALSAVGAIWFVGHHDRGVVAHAMSESRELESAGRMGAAISAVESAKDQVWFFGADALEGRRAALKFRASRPEVWPHKD